MSVLKQSISDTMEPEAITPLVGEYLAPRCEVQEMVPERLIAASGGLSDDSFEIINW